MKNSSFYKMTTDIIISIILFLVFLWCVFLAWGAYSQHRITVLINAEIIQELKDSIITQTSNTSTSLPVLTEQDIARFQEAQNNLFDTNTQSFIFQFVTLFILAVGTSILAIMYSQYRKEQEHANELISTLGPFVRGQNMCVIIASKYCFLYSLCRLHGTTTENNRYVSLALISDYQNDILRHLNFALREKEGFEKYWHEVILDMAEQVKRYLEMMAETSTGVEKTSFREVSSVSKECYKIIWKNGVVFSENYEKYWKKITGDSFLPLE